MGSKIPPERRDGNNKIAQSLDALYIELTKYVEICEANGKAVTSEGIGGFIERFQHRDDNAPPRAIADYLDFLIKGMREGTFLNGNDRYSSGTIKVWVTFANVYRRFERFYENETGEVIVWETLDKEKIDAFCKWMEDYGYLTKTINKYLITFKAAINYAATFHKLHTNTSCMSLIHKLTEKKGCATTKVYLNTDEIDALYDMELPAGSLQDKVRDIFLVGVFTAQRVSDYSRIRKESFSTTSRGTKVIRLVQVKTDAEVVIPIMDERLQAIAEKYDYNLPDLGMNGDVIINSEIKKICKVLSESVPSLREYIRTTLNLRDRQCERKGRKSFYRDEAGNTYKPKYELVSTHSARRSGITNMYKSGLFSVRQMMSISGHTTEANFFAYLVEGADEFADEINARLEASRKKQTSNEDLF